MLDAHWSGVLPSKKKKKDLSKAEFGSRATAVMSLTPGWVTLTDNSRVHACIFLIEAEFCVRFLVGPSNLDTVVYQLLYNDFI